MAVTLKDVLRNHVKEKLARDEVVASMIVRAVRGIEIAQHVLDRYLQPDLHRGAGCGHHAVRARTHARA
jgi:hypothetical protein